MGTTLELVGSKGGQIKSKRQRENVGGGKKEKKKKMKKRRAGPFCSHYLFATEKNGGEIRGEYGTMRRRKRLIHLQECDASWTKRDSGNRERRRQGTVGNLSVEPHVGLIPPSLP